MLRDRAAALQQRQQAWTLDPLSEDFNGASDAEEALKPHLRGDVLKK